MADPVQTIASRRAASSDKGPIPRIIALGGDHTTTLPALRAAYQRWGVMSVVHFDAHIGEVPGDASPGFFSASNLPVHRHLGPQDPWRRVQLCVGVERGSSSSSCTDDETGAPTMEHFSISPMKKVSSRTIASMLGFVHQTYVQPRTGRMTNAAASPPSRRVILTGSEPKASSKPSRGELGTRRFTSASISMFSIRRMRLVRFSVQFDPIRRSR